MKRLIVFCHGFESILDNFDWWVRHINQNDEKINQCFWVMFSHNIEWRE